MKWTSSLVDSLSGSMGGRTASIARGGIGYFRTRVVPRNPRSTLQLAIRAAMASASVYWNTLLAEADQEAWWDLATGGQTGQALFVKANQPRVYATNSGRTTGITGTYAAKTLDVVTTPPLSSSTGLTTPTAIVIDDSANTLAFTANALDEYNAAVLDSGQTCALFVYASHQQNASRFSRQHPYQLLAAVTRVVDDDPIAGVVINLATHGFTTAVGKVMYLRFVAITHDGKVSTPIEVRVPITA